MNHEPQGDGRDPEVFRTFLACLARMHLDPRLQSKLDADDIVQETLLEAHQHREQFRGEHDGSLKAWLRQILLNKLKTALDKFRAAKRDVAGEQSLNVALEKSSARLQALLAVEQSSPSEIAQRNELALQLDQALADLPERQREVVVLKHYHDWTLAEISKQLNLTQTAVVGLLHRGLKNLRSVLGEPE